MVYNNTEMCTGCGLCASVCPKKCLTIELNYDGFYFPKLNDASLCVDCGICQKICPQNIYVGDLDPLRVLSAVSKNAETLKLSSSGGICYELAKDAIESGKKVCACVYDYEKHRAVHKVIECVEELAETRGSKYFQSYTTEAFEKIFDGNEWVVFGTPCQIAAIDKMARFKNMRDNYVLVDFFCHGTPSMNLWKKYIGEHNGSEIKKIEFRSKEFGWHKFSLKFFYRDNTTESDYQENMFYRFFFNNLILNNSCYDCHFKALKSCSDIRVGDFWGEKYADDTVGVSCCVVFSEKGDALMNSMNKQCVIKDEVLSDVLEEQMKVSPPLRRERKRILKAIQGQKNLRTIFDCDLFIYRLKCKCKSFFGG